MTVAASTYDTFRIEQKDVYPADHFIKSNTCTLWLSPKVPFPVKSQCMQETNGGKADSATELVSFTQGA